MTDTEINIAIAEWCGLISYRTEAEYEELMAEWDDEEPHPHSCLTKPGRIKYKVYPLPSYTTDLNAMHEAEGKLTEKQWFNFHQELVWITGTKNWGTAFEWRDRFASIHATARQRAEALLRTIGKWRDA